MSRQWKSMRRGMGSLSLYAAVLLLGVVAALTVYVFLDKHRHGTQVDAERIKQLATARLSDAASPVNDWPQWRGPNRDGVSTEKGLLEKWPDKGPKELWRQPVGKGYSSMAVARGRVFTIFQVGADEAICCWNAGDGKEIWRFRYPARYTNSFGDGPRSTPTIAGDHLYAVGGSGIMHCLKAFSDKPQGEQIWRKDLLTEFGARNLQWGTCFSALVHGDLVYINPGGSEGKSLAALEKDTGKIRWTSEDDPAGYSSPLAADIAGVKQVVFFTGSGLVAVTPDKGELLWRYPWETSYGANIATPIVVDDYVFISSGYNRGCTVVKIDKTNAGLKASRVYEHKKMSTHFSSCVRFKDHLYGFHDTRLTCMDFRTGKVKWSESGFDKGSLMIVDGSLVILGEYGVVALADASPDSYRERSRFRFSEKKCWTVPVVSNGLLFIRDEETLCCYDVKR